MARRSGRESRPKGLAVVDQPVKSIAQIDLARAGTSSPGHIHWSMKALLRDQGGIDKLLPGGPYREKALTRHRVDLIRIQLHQGLIA